MTPAQRDLILHALGLTPRGGRMRRWSYRNHYCACVHVVSDSEDAILAGMVDQDWLVAGRTINDGRDRFYHVTRAGAVVAGVLGRTRAADIAFVSPPCAGWWPMG